MNKIDERVSIPFKRESVSELKVEAEPAEPAEPVSIPFKRESVSEQCWRYSRYRHCAACFNSLQTGKRI